MLSVFLKFPVHHQHLVEGHAGFGNSLGVMRNTQYTAHLREYILVCKHKEYVHYPRPEAMKTLHIWIKKRKEKGNTRWILLNTVHHGSGLGCWCWGMLLQLRDAPFIKHGWQCIHRTSFIVHLLKKTCLDWHQWSEMCRKEDSWSFAWCRQPRHWKRSDEVRSRVPGDVWPSSPQHRPLHRSVFPSQLPTACSGDGKTRRQPRWPHWDCSQHSTGSETINVRRRS